MAACGTTGAGSRWAPRHPLPRQPVPSGRDGIDTPRHSGSLPGRAAGGRSFARSRPSPRCRRYARVRVGSSCPPGAGAGPGEGTWVAADRGTWVACRQPPGVPGAPHSPGVVAVAVAQAPGGTAPPGHGREPDQVHRGAPGAVPPHLPGQDRARSEAAAAVGPGAPARRPPAPPGARSPPVLAPPRQAPGAEDVAAGASPARLAPPVPAPSTPAPPAPPAPRCSSGPAPPAAPLQRR
jgi:hypothetical protein